MKGLRAQLIEHDPSPDGPQAYVSLIEPNGDANLIRCLCPRYGRPVVVEFGEGEVLPFLFEKYGEQTVFALASFATLYEQPAMAQP